jgi:hypothetical protein
MTVAGQNSCVNLEASSPWQAREAGREEHGGRGRRGCAAAGPEAGSIQNSSSTAPALARSQFCWVQTHDDVTSRMHVSACICKWVAQCFRSRCPLYVRLGFRVFVRRQTRSRNVRTRRCERNAQTGRSPRLVETREAPAAHVWSASTLAHQTGARTCGLTFFLSLLGHGRLGRVCGGRSSPLSVANPR